MNIAFVTTEFLSEESSTDGGLGNYIYKISKILIKHNHKVTIIVVSNENKEIEFENILVERVSIIFTNPIYLLLKKLTGLGDALDWIWQSYLLNRRVKKLDSLNPFDIVQYSNFKATAFFKPNHIPTVIRLSSFHPFWREAMGVRKDSIEDKLMGKLEQNAVRKGDAVFSPSRVIAEAMSSSTGKDVTIIETLFTIPESLNLDILTIYPKLRNKKYLLFIGKLNKLKGAGLIADIIYKLLANNKDLHFVFAGRDAGYKDIIITNAKEHSSRLEFLGKVKKEDMAAVIKNSYAVILPSEMDNLPNACIESMSLGKIVIGTYGASFEQLIDDGYSGFLIRSFKSDTLLKKIQELLILDPERKKNIENNALNRVKLLDPERIMKETINLYENTIGKFNNV